MAEASANPSGDVGVLLVNLGTPDAPTPAAVRRYLAEFLSDRRVIEIPPFAWQPILRGIVLNTRPRRSAHAYAQVWSEAGAPLLAITAAQAADLARRLDGSADSVDDPSDAGAIRVSHAMRYGNPAIAGALARLHEAGCGRILVAPLYPQYCAATTASVFDAVAAAMARLRRQPALRFLPPYYADPLYIDALGRDLSRQLRALDFVPEVLLLSFHGMPERTRLLGDPYHDQCRTTARLLAGRLAADHPDLSVETAFQSRFGRARWLEPATDATLVAQAQAGTRRLAIAAPGFAADCLETREELAIRGREQFLGAGGTAFVALDCLNAGKPGMAMLEALIRRELRGWA